MGVLSRIGIGCCGLYRGTKFSIAIAAAFLATAFFPDLARTQSLEGLGFLQSSNQRSSANGVSADGTTAVGDSNCCNFGIPGGAFRWDANNGIISLGAVPGASQSFASAVNTDGSVVVGYSGSVGTYPLYQDTFQAFRWTQSGGIAGLGTLSGKTKSYAWGVSADGSVVVGHSSSGSTNTDEAFRWTQSAGMVGLGFLPGQVGGRSFAYGVSADGSVVVGAAGTPGVDQAFRWTQAGGMVGLGYLTAGTFSIANAVSGDGKVVVGHADMPSGGNQNIQAFRWTQATGMVSIGTGVATATNSDGSVVVGYDAAAFRWTVTGGMKDLKTLAQNSGINVSGWTLSRASGVSADGDTIVGVGFDPNGKQQAWLLNGGGFIAGVAARLPDSANSNQRGVSGGIDNAIANGATLSSAFNTLLGLTGSALTTALNQINGEAGGHGGSRGASNMMGSFLTLALNPFGGSSGGNIGGIGSGRGFGFAAEQELPPEAAQAYAAVTPKDRRAASTLDRRWGVWGQAYGGYNRTGGDTGTGTHDTVSRSYGLATGADYRASADLMVGFALAGGGTNYGLSDGLGGGKSDMFQIGFYGSKQFGAVYLSAALSYAWHGMKTDRTVTISGTDILTASFNAHSFGGRLESGYKFDAPFVSITPYAALQMQQFRTPSYSETAASGSSAFALSYDAKSTKSTRTELGIWLDKMIALDRGNVLAIRTRAAWAHDHSSDQSTSAAFQALPGSSFTMNGAATVPNSALLSAGAEIRLASGVSFGAKFDGEFARRSQTYAGTGTVRYVW